MSETRRFCRLGWRILAVLSLCIAGLVGVTNPASAGDGSAQLSLPFPAGQSWTLTGGPHSNLISGGRPWSSLDFQGPGRVGTVVAARAGIAYVECGGARVRIDHLDGWQTTYFHLAGVPNLHRKPVSRGQRLGSISTSTGICGGRATGPHVHFTVWRNGSPVNIRGLDIGGWTVEDGAASYRGCLRRVRDGRRVCQWGSVHNDGAVGSGANRDQPYGSVDLVASRAPGSIRVAGWAIDPNNTAAAVRIHVYVGGPAGSGAPGHDIGPAGGPRPDVGSHAFDTTVPGPGGTYPVCVYAINVGPGANVELGCRTVGVANPDPYGSLDLVESTTPGRIRVAGWAIDPNDPAAVVNIHVYVGGRAGSGAPGHNIGPAGGSRPDVGAHAFDTTVAGPAGTYPVCVYAINIGPGTNVELGCRTVTSASA